MEEGKKWRRRQDDQSGIASVFLIEDSSPVIQVAAIPWTREVTLNPVEDEVPWAVRCRGRRESPICAKGPRTGTPLCQGHPAR